MIESTHIDRLDTTMDYQHRITGPDFAGYTDADLRRVRNLARMQLPGAIQLDTAQRRTEYAPLLKESIERITTELNRRFTDRLDAQQNTLPSPPTGAPNLLDTDPEPWAGHPNEPVSPEELARLIAEDDRA